MALSCLTQQFVSFALDYLNKWRIQDLTDGGSNPLELRQIMGFSRIFLSRGWLSVKFLHFNQSVQNPIKLALFTLFMYSHVFLIEICGNWFIWHYFIKITSGLPFAKDRSFPHLRIHSLYRYVPKDQQFVTSAHINNSSIEEITPIKHALVLQ